MDTKEATAKPDEPVVQAEASAADAPPVETTQTETPPKVAAGAFAKMVGKAQIVGLLKMAKMGREVFGRVISPVKAVLSLPLLVFQGSFASRLISLGFAASVLLVLITGYKLTKRFVPASWFNSTKVQTADSFNKYLEQQKEYAIASASVLFLERHTTTVTSEGGKVRYLEVEFYAECDQPDTCRTVKGHMIGIRELLTTAIQGRSYDKLITESGKETFRQDVLRALNDGLVKWKIKGSIRRIFMTSFVMA